MERAPLTEILRLPKEYGSPTTPLEWTSVAGRIERAQRYWLATVRDGAVPHVRPIDAIWLDETLHFGGSLETIWHKVLSSNPEVTIHLEDALQAVIAEGRVRQVTPARELAERIASATTAKYGYPTRAEDYQIEVWTFRPRRVYAWTNLPENATRFTFE